MFWRALSISPTRTHTHTHTPVHARARARMHACMQARTARRNAYTELAQLTVRELGAV